MGSPLVVSPQAKRDFFCSTTGVSPELKKTKAYDLRQFEVASPTEAISPTGSSQQMGDGLGGTNNFNPDHLHRVKLSSKEGGEDNTSNSIGFKIKINKMPLLD